MNKNNFVAGEPWFTFELYQKKTGLKREEEQPTEQAVISRGIEVESLENLQKVFDSIQHDKQTKTFVYNNIQFWKVNRRFQFSDTNELISYAPPISFETFVAAFNEFK